jgi:NTP pyrophosphatase (non-canonical NTP hydrolase)
MCINCEVDNNPDCTICACVGCSEGNCCDNCVQTAGFDRYQKNAADTARGGVELSREKGRVAIASMGLAGESGELIDYLKKWVGHDHDLDQEYVKKELGDVLWYVSEIATALGMSLQQVAMLNREKLLRRYPNGFEANRSINRVE